MRFLRAALCAALFSVCLLSVPASANDITLTSRDGSIELNGTLLGYDGEYYRVETEYGVLTVDGSGVLCDGPACPSLGPFVAEFTLSGAREMGSVLMPSLIEGFAIRSGYALSRENLAGVGKVINLFEGDEGGAKAAQITIRQTSSDEGFSDLIAGLADIVLSLREISDAEKQAGFEAGLGNLRSARQARVIALDALVPVVASGNPVKHLSMEQMMAIYAGKVTSWAELGGENAPITAYLLEDGEGFTDVFINLLSSSGQEISHEVLRKPTNAALIQAVAEDPFGIAIATFSQPGDTEIVTLSGACGYQIAASAQAIRAEDYPLTAPLYMYLPARRMPKVAREFLAYMRSEAAQLVIRRVGLVHQTPGESPIDVQGRRLANAIHAAGEEIGLEELKRLAQMVEAHTRLSLTFRFRGGASSLDAPSLSNIQILAQALEAGWYDGRVMRFVGFTDGLGSATQNQRLALRRAGAVLQAVRSAAETLDDGRVEMHVEAFGEALPMACDDSSWGRQVNRRVEVWLQ